MRWFMLDTNMVSYLVNERSPVARRRLENLPPGYEACLSSVTEGELLYGLARRTLPKSRSQAVVFFLRAARVLPWGRQEAAVYGKLRAGQEALSRRIADLDLLIAAHAIAIDATLVTADRAFSQVAGLRATENWATDLT